MAGRPKKFGENTFIMPEVMDFNTRWILSQVHRSGDWPVSPTVITLQAWTATLRTQKFWIFLMLRTRVDIKHDSQHGSFLSENATGDENNKLKIS